jgi:GNAT superfamily N-acetyltransferase
MGIYHRPYRHREDLTRIGRLIRWAYAQAPGCNAWSFARFDIWAQRRLADEQVHGKHDWQQTICLWETEPDELAGATLFANEHSAALLYSPDRPEVAEPMLVWAERRYTQRGRVDKPLTIEATESNPALEQLLKSRGYAQPVEHYVRREKPLADSGPETVRLPDSYYVKSIETLAELGAFHKAVEEVFRFRDSVEVYQILQQAPSYVPELDLILLAPTREIASFCTVWLDRDNGLAEFEPVGTVPGYRKQGLGAALLADASNRLRAAGCKTVTVYSWSAAVGANRLYAGAGLEGNDRLYAWQWQGS